MFGARALLHYAAAKYRDDTGNPEAAIRAAITAKAASPTSYKSLRRYLARRYNISPEEHRRKWWLPESYPKVALNFSRSRSLAAKDKRMGSRRFVCGIRRLRCADALWHRRAAFSWRLVSVPVKHWGPPSDSFPAGSSGGDIALGSWHSGCANSA